MKTLPCLARSTICIFALLACAFAQVSVQCPSLPCTITVTATPPPPVCNAPGVLVNNACTCPAPNALVNGVCTAPTQATGVLITPKSLTFSAALNTDSAIQYITLTNQGSQSVPLDWTLSTASTQFNYGGLGTCTASLAGLASCTMSLKYHPTTAGTATGIDTINAGGVVTVVNLTGSTSPILVVSGISLTWNAQAGVTFKVYRSTVKGGPYTAVSASTTNSYVDATAVKGTTYYYVVRAVDSTGKESTNSNEVQITF